MTDLRAELRAAGSEAAERAERYGCGNPDHIDEAGQPTCRDGILRRYPELAPLIDALSKDTTSG